MLSVYILSVYCLQFVQTEKGLYRRGERGDLERREEGRKERGEEERGGKGREERPPSVHSILVLTSAR